MTPTDRAVAVARTLGLIVRGRLLRRLGLAILFVTLAGCFTPPGLTLEQACAQHPKHCPRPTK